MKQNDFIKLKQPEWDAFEAALKQHASKEEMDEDFPARFRQLSHDFAVAKSRCYSPPVIEKLNVLLLMGQRQLYVTKVRPFSALKTFFATTLPSHLREMRAYIIWAHFVFYGLAVLSYGLVVYQPELIYHVISSQQVASIEWMYDPTSEHYGKERPSDGDFEMFGYYILNNISIAFQCFVGGVLIGFGALYFLLFNAIYLSAIAGHIVNINYSSTFFSFVITHGAFELTAIVLSAAAGFVVGKHLLMPGSLSRAESLRLGGKRSYPILFLAFLMLVVAAFLEAFWSSSRFIPNEIKYGVGGICWLFVLSFIFWGHNTFKRVKHAN